MAALHDIVVKAGFSADEFIFLRDKSDSLGLSQSAFLRLLVNQDRRKDALNSLSPNGLAYEMAESGQGRA